MAKRCGFSLLVVLTRDPEIASTVNAKHVGEESVRHEHGGGTSNNRRGRVPGNKQVTSAVARCACEASKSSIFTAFHLDPPALTPVSLSSRVEGQLIQALPIRWPNATSTISTGRLVSR
eukprot:scaffold298638_cov35-Tisochrysis_lutea.AAC.2